jgi:hypothetical protein
MAKKKKAATKKKRVATAPAERSSLVTLADKTTAELKSLYEISADAALRARRNGKPKTGDRRLALDIIDELATRGEDTGEQEHHPLWTGPLS